VGRLRWLFVLGALATATAAFAQTLLTQAELMGRARPVASATVRYGPDPLQVVDVWLPRGRGPFPTVVMIHGGCWQTSLADRHLMDWAADDLRRRGYAVWNIEYRGVDRPGGGYPGTFTDVAAATDAIRPRAAQFHIDTRRIVAVGHSAGGHLALWLAARPRLPARSKLHSDSPLPIAAVVSLGGLPDLERNMIVDNGCGRAVNNKLARGHFDETSVPRLAPLNIPQYLVNGSEDPIVPAELVVDYRRRMTAAGDRVQLDLVPDSGHFELIAPGSRAWLAVLRKIGVAERS
jgi:acetyl esterase/lipase